jgi:putative RecB family exonuclease
MAYSHSAISTFETCPHKFKLAYLDRLAPLRKNIEGFLGVRVHEALEKLYRDLLYERHTALDELLAFYNERWEREMCSAVFVAKEYDVDNYRMMGERYLTDYYTAYNPFDEGRTIALEKRVFFPLDNAHWIVGVIDRITEADGIYEVHDYKTSLYMPTQQDIEHDCQLALYALALDYLYGVDDIELVWHFLAFNRELRLRKKTYEGVREEILAKIDRIEQAKETGDFPAKESGLCPYCGYQPVCPLFKHEFDLREKSPTEVTRGDGFTLVNEYARVTQQLAELKQRRQELEEQLASFARKNGVQFVYGADTVANVKTYTNVHFADREAVEKAVRETGRYDEFSRLDTFKLAKGYEAGALPQSLRERLATLADEKEVVRIYLRTPKKN